MKLLTKLSTIITASLLFILFNSSICPAQTWQEQMDSVTGYYEKQDFESALKWAKKSLISAEKEFGVDTNYLKSVSLIADIYYSLGQVDSTFFYMEKNLSIGRRVLKGDHPLLLQAINGMAYLNHLAGNFKESELLFREALDMTRRLYKGYNVILDAALSNMAQFYSSQSRYAEAEPLFKEDMELRRQLYKGDNANLATSITYLGVLYHKMSLDSLSGPLLREALEMNRRLYQGDNPELGYSLNNMATYYQDNGDFINAEPLFDESIGMHRRIYKEDHPDLAFTLSKISVFKSLIGRNSEAEALFSEGLKMHRRIYKTEDPRLSEFLNSVAIFYNEQGRYAEAETLFAEALDIYRRLIQRDNPNLAMLIINMGNFYENRGSIAEAEKLIKEGFDMISRLYTGDHHDLAYALNSMAFYYMNTEQYKLAGPLLLKSLEMTKRLQQGDHPDIIQRTVSVAYYYELTGDYKSAETYYIEALAMARRIYHYDHPDLANSIANLSYFYYLSGNYDEAVNLVKEAIEMRKRLMNEDNIYIAAGKNNLARIFFIKNELSKAEPLFNESLNSFSSIMNRYFPSLSEKEKKHFWNTIKDFFEVFNNFAIIRSADNPAILNNFFETQLFSKGILLNSAIKMKNRILSGNDSTLVRKFEDWQFLKDKIGKHLSSSAQERTSFGINLDSLEKIINEKEKELSRLSEDFAKLSEKKSIKWTDIRDNIGNEEAAIEIIRLRYFENKKFTDKVYYAALIVKKTSKNPELVLLKNGNDLEGKYIEQYRKQIEKQKLAIYDADIVEKSLKELFRQFWLPIQQKLKGIKTVYLSVDGVYNQLNLNTLVNPKTKKYLLDEIDLRIVTSTRDLASIDNKENDNENMKAVLFGDPLFNIDSAKYNEIAQRYIADNLRSFNSTDMNLDNISRAGITELPGTRKEIETIAKKLENKGWKTEKKIGAEALEEAIKSVNNPRVLHIATHGIFLKDVERKGDERSFGFESERYVENPLLKSMLLFSGAENSINRKKQTTDMDDGLLTAYEAQNLSLDKTELVVLSACETGLGEIKNGEGVYGLQRAFKVAGAKTIIMSLWSVSDKATQELMTNFYSKWLNGDSKRNAFRESQKELRQKYPGFYYWGGFVMVGE